MDENISNTPQDSTIVVDTDLPPTQVLDFYRERMKAAGWQELETPMGMHRGGFTHGRIAHAFDANITFCRSSRGPFAWSTWTLRDEDNEPWYGGFIIMRVPVQQLQYTLYIQANMETGMPPSGGWFSSHGPMTML